MKTLKLSTRYSFHGNFVLLGPASTVDSYCQIVPKETDYYPGTCPTGFNKSHSGNKTTPTIVL